jgi:hypothetical protein
MRSHSRLRSKTIIRKIIEYINAPLLLCLHRLHLLKIHSHDHIYTSAMIEDLVVKRKSGAYLRFGDGDINLLWGLPDMMSAATKEIQADIARAFKLRSTSSYALLKSLPLYCDQLGNVQPNTKSTAGFFGASNYHCFKLIALARRYILNQELYCSVFMSYYFSTDPDRYLAILKVLLANPTVLVSPYSRSFSSYSPIAYSSYLINCPKENAYSEIESIEKRLLDYLESNQSVYHVVILAMGCAGRALVARLLSSYKLNAFIFDIGSSFDALYGNISTRAWMHSSSTQEDLASNVTYILSHLKEIETGRVIG